MRRDCFNFHASACSRPPLPISKTSTDIQAFYPVRKEKTVGLPVGSPYSSAANPACGPDESRCAVGVVDDTQCVDPIPAILPIPRALCGSHTHAHKHICFCRAERTALSDDLHQTQVFGASRRL